MKAPKKPVPTPLPAECCAKCRFFLSADAMVCRRYPPQVALDGRSNFPGMMPLGWCGEFKVKASAI